ncbi:hypothetical protein Hypma_014779 [Hypsizygus marmoreus]|uniref:HAT C-terminal dimerisation domain-containing protein n=1 Tax=Hypsizygus marmoreus TaxID=39966 RepID=A0A369J9F5_HYPMA|nr:hypothetical protein Hypma_014779 [Hypsizygus marmoreus]
MSWIHEHWEHDWVTHVESIIKDTIKEYHECLKISEPERSKPKKTSVGWLNLGLALEFMEDDNMSWGASNSGGPMTVDQEFRDYGGHLSKLDTDIVKFWEVHREEYLTVYAILLNFMAIKASAIPCKRAFSSSAEMDRLHRNRIHPALMEALQMLKFAYRNVPSPDLLADMMDPSIQENLHEDALDAILQLSAEPGEDEVFENDEFEKWIMV